MIFPLEAQTSGSALSEAPLNFRVSRGYPKSRTRLVRVFSCLGDGLCPILGSISAGVVPIGLIGVVN
jgi:hypothetical protein